MEPSKYQEGSIQSIQWPPESWKEKPMPQPVDDTKLLYGTEALLAERGKTHGAIEDNAYWTEELLSMLMRGSGPMQRRAKDAKADHLLPWDDLNATQRLCLMMIVHKIGRIMSGQADEPDHWKDIAGYATLVEQRCGR